MSLTKPMEARLTALLKQLNEANSQFRDGKLKPVAHGDLRLSIIKQGLQLVADNYGFPAGITYTSTGEFEFYGNKGNQHGACAPFGDDLAQLLRGYQTRTGAAASTGHVIASNGWTRIGHFEAERLLRDLAAGSVELLPAQKVALKAFQDRHGRQWKSKLSDCWMKASYPGMSDDESSALQQLRNTCGPSWLSSYQPETAESAFTLH